jgi:predicted nucleic acid-binding protein
MARVDLRRFARRLAGVRLVGLDTAALIYHLEDIAPYSELTTVLLTRAAAGSLRIVLSTVVVAESLVGPWKLGDEVAARIEDALRALPGTLVADLTWAIAARAARMRAQTGLPLPDSLVIATAVEQGASLMLTNDAAWRGKALHCRVAVLEDFLAD